MVKDRDDLPDSGLLEVEEEVTKTDPPGRSPQRPGEEGFKPDRDEEITLLNTPGPSRSMGSSQVLPSSPPPIPPQSVEDLSAEISEVSFEESPIHMQADDLEHAEGGPAGLFSEKELKHKSSGKRPLDHELFKPPPVPRRRKVVRQTASGDSEWPPPMEESRRLVRRRMEVSIRDLIMLLLALILGAGIVIGWHIYSDYRERSLREAQPPSSPTPVKSERD